MSSEPLDLTVTDRLAAVAAADPTSGCPTGTAEVRSHHTSTGRTTAIEWLRADEVIHVSREVIRQPGAIALFADRYMLDAPCPKAPGAWHCRRRPGVDEHGNIAGQGIVTLGDDGARGDAP